MTAATTIDLWSWRAISSSHHSITSTYFLILVCALFTCLTIHYQLPSLRNRWICIPLAGLDMLLGMIISGIIRLAGGYSYEDSVTFESHFDPKLLGFSSTVFYFGLLPIIVFESGYHLKRHLFYRNLIPILLLAFAGTAISICIVTIGIYWMHQMQVFGFQSPISLLESICFAALISSTDPVSTLAVFSSLRVDPQVYYLVFGESVLNDAVAITVFTVASQYIQSLSSISNGPLNTQLASIPAKEILLSCTIKSLVSFVLSSLLGYICGITLTYLSTFYKNRSNSQFQLLSLLLMMYIPFFIAECLQFSGIVSVLFAGISLRRFYTKNVSKSSRLVMSYVLKSLVELADTSCFFLIGMTLFSHSFADFNTLFILTTLCLILFARALHVYPLLSMANCLNFNSGIEIKRNLESKEIQMNPINYNSQHAFTQSGHDLDKEGDDVETHIEPHKYEESDIQPDNVDLLYDQTNPSNHDKDETTGKLVTLPMMHMICFSGLRGAVSFSCAEIFPNQLGHRNVIICTTTVIIMTTIFLQASLNPTAIQLLGIKAGIKRKEGIREGCQQHGCIYQILAYIDNWERRHLYPVLIYLSERGNLKQNVSTDTDQLENVSLHCNAFSQGSSHPSPLSSGGGSLFTAASSRSCSPLS